MINALEVVAAANWVHEKGHGNEPGDWLDSFLQTPLQYAFSFSGCLYWMLAVLALSALASIAPALSATRVTVRDVLAYE